MKKTAIVRTSLALVALAALRCGSEEPMTLLLGERTSERISGGLWTEETEVEFTSTPSAPLAGVATLHVASPDHEHPHALDFELRYDYAAGVVTSDGLGERLDRESHRTLRAATDLLARQLGPDDPTLPLHEQMLFAAFVVLSESGGMPLSPVTFEMGPRDAPGDTEDKSLGNDGVGCIQRGATYLASFDFGETVIVDTPITADSHSCNGMCGPSCTQLTTWRMWTLDCLEHDSCCNAIGDDTTCWTPLGECGDEYNDAVADFLRGFDPFRRHCGG